jgi:phosphoribosyl-AMP cyclohydrolase
MIHHPMGGGDNANSNAIKECSVVILAWKSLWGNPPPPNKMWDACQQSHNTKQHMNAFKKIYSIANMADLLKQMWFLLTMEVYKLWHKGTTSGEESIRNFDEDLNERVRTDVVNRTLLKCTATEFRTWAVLPVHSVLPVHQVRTEG